jgi:hypothetical protein
MVTLDGDVWARFPDSKTVNAALRTLIADGPPGVQLKKAS